MHRLTVAFLLVACGSSTPSERLSSRLRDCDLLSTGPVNELLVPDTDNARCIGECLTEASCPQLSGFVCGDTSLTEQCRDQCSPSAACADGAEIPIRLVCNGMNNCADGRDEADCETFTCDDGTSIPSGLRCNYNRECADGTDEQGCPDGFLCGDGKHIQDFAVCDGRLDCEDRSDEGGCPQFICDDGTVLPGANRCDLFAQCPDESDEVGCAIFTGVCLME